MRLLRIGELLSACTEPVSTPPTPTAKINAIDATMTNLELNPPIRVFFIL